MKYNKPQTIVLSLLLIAFIALFTWWWNMPRIIGQYNIEVVEKIHEPVRSYTQNESRRYTCGLTYGMKFDGSMGTKTKYCTDHYIVTYLDDEDYVAIVKQKRVYDNGHVEYKMVRVYVNFQLWDKVIVGKPFQNHWKHEYKMTKGDRHTKVGEKKL
jgi:hypothetical protein